MGIDSENNLFRILPPYFKTRIERAVFNRRKRRLISYQNAIRMKLAESFNKFEDVFVLDSMSSKGDCASQKMCYYGYKLLYTAGKQGLPFFRYPTQSFLNLPISGWTHLKRTNQKEYKPYLSMYRKSRKKMKTLILSNVQPVYDQV